MSLLQKIKTNLNCVSGRHYSVTNDIRGLITSKSIKMLKVIVLSVGEKSQ